MALWEAPITPTVMGVSDESSLASMDGVRPVSRFIERVSGMSTGRVCSFGDEPVQRMTRVVMALLGSGLEEPGCSMSISTVQPLV